MTAFGFPNFGQLEGTTTARTFEWVIGETGLYPSTLGEVAECPSQRFQVEQRHLKAEHVKSGVDGVSQLAFDIAGVKTSVAHQVHAFGREVGDQA